MTPTHEQMAATLLAAGYFQDLLTRQWCSPVYEWVEMESAYAAVRGCAG